MKRIPTDQELLRGILAGLSANELTARYDLLEDEMRSRLEAVLDRIVESGGLHRQLPRVGHPRLAKLLRLWDQRRNGRNLPVYGELRINDLQPWMEHLVVVEMGESPPRPKFRLVGRECIRYGGMGDLIGRYLDDVVPEPAREAALRPFFDCAGYRAPQYIVLESALSGEEGMSYHRLLLPHASDGCTVDIVLAGIYLEANPDAEEMVAEHGIYDVLFREAG